MHEWILWKPIRLNKSISLLRSLADRFTGEKWFLLVCRWVACLSTCAHKWLPFGMMISTFTHARLLRSVVVIFLFFLLTEGTSREKKERRVNYRLVFHRQPVRPDNCSALSSSGSFVFVTIIVIITLVIDMRNAGGGISCQDFTYLCIWNNARQARAFDEKPTLMNRLSITHLKAISIRTRWWKTESLPGCEYNGDAYVKRKING